jgi:hypothetical protein
VSPAYGQSEGHLAILLTSAYGYTPDPWQADILTDWLAKDQRGKWVSADCGLSVPRQNGKNIVAEMRELYGMVVLGEKWLHTAHQVKTTYKAFRRMVELFENKRQYPELTRLVKTIRRANGQESIELENGGSVEYIARTKSSGLGFTVDCLLFDEAQELTDEQLEALMPTISASPLDNSQIIYLGTAPRPGNPAEVFNRMRQKAHSDDCDMISWNEWTVSEIGDVTDRLRWAKSNPSLGRHLSVDRIESEASVMAADGFARERLGFWPIQSSQSVIDMKLWSALATTDPPMEGKTAYGVKFSIDGAHVSLASCIYPKDGRPHVELIEYQSMYAGIRWLVAWLEKRWKTATVIIIDGRGTAQALYEALVAESVSKRVLRLAQTTNVIAAAAMVLSGITDKTFTHFDQPELNEIASNARKRSIGREGGWGWGGMEDVSPLDAVSLALWGCVNSGRDPTKKQKVSF